jgi:hypothetical protein
MAFINNNSKAYKAPSFESYFTKKAAPVAKVEKDLATMINSFPFQYEMSSMSSKWDEGNRLESKIKRQLADLSQDQIIDLRKSITVHIDLVNRYFAKFFNQTISA